MRAAIILLAVAAIACDPPRGAVGAGGEATGSVAGAADQPPVATNPVSPVEYPPALFEQGVEGRVLLRLYVDSGGRVVPDSTRLAESSGYPALDSAALAGAAGLRFSPALRGGRPVAGPFLQPIQFRNPRAREKSP